MVTSTFLEQAPKIIPVLTDSANLVVNIIFAVITFLAVLIALFQELIGNFFRRAELSMEINLDSPNSFKIKSGGHDDLFYVRIKVNSVKGRSAENIEIMATNFWKIENGKRIKVSNFCPMNLNWSNIKQGTVRIPKGMFKHCDLCFFLKNYEDSRMQLFLDTIVRPNKVSDYKLGNVFDPGEYEIELLLSGDNVKLIKNQWKIIFDEWNNDEDVLRHAIKIIKL